MSEKKQTLDILVHEAPSPNFSERPKGVDVDCVVLHATVFDSLNEVIAHFASKESKVSAHYTIDRDGRIVAHVDEGKRARHAGYSEMPDGRTGVNDFSIGIELVNRNSGDDPYPSEQIASLIRLIQDIKTRYPIKHIVSHREVAVPPGRKNDPLGLDLDMIRNMVS